MSQKINHKFANPELLERALTHKSFSGAESNERMEFLGDAVLDMVITEYIYSQYPDLQEGELAKMRADVVCASSLVKIADELCLTDDLILGKSEKLDDNAKPSILADAMEAVIAAIYLDGGLAAIKPLVLDWFKPAVEEAAKNPGMTDYKTRLQELAVKKFGQIPEYEIKSEGPDHNKFFYATVNISDKDLGKGMGNTKKEAAQGAAKQAYETLGDK